MATRLELQSKLEELNRNSNVYYQPPESVKMAYDAIKYSKKNIIGRFADDRIYSKMNCYELTVIARKADPEVVDKILELPYCSFDRYYVSNNLHHYVLTLYW